LFLSDSVFQKIRKLEKEKGFGFIPNGHDLYLTGSDNINEKLFGDSLNYGEHWNDKFIITGKAIDIKGYGIVFRVDTYEKVTSDK
jgi:hypothetical protein